MTVIRLWMPFLATVVFLVGAVIGIVIPSNQTGWWFGLSLLVLVIFVLVARGRKTLKRAKALEVLAQLFVAFIGGLLTAALALMIKGTEKLDLGGSGYVVEHVTFDGILSILLGIALYLLAQLLHIWMSSVKDELQP